MGDLFVSTSLTRHLFFFVFVKFFFLTTEANWMQATLALYVLARELMAEREGRRCIYYLFRVVVEAPG